jgi:hypothetical protein
MRRILTGLGGLAVGMTTNQPDAAESRSGDAPAFPVGGDSLDAAAVRTTAHASWLWAAAIGTLIADVALTAYGLRLGLAELNPVAADLIAEVGLLPALGLLKGGAVAVAVGGWTVMPPDYRGLVPAGLTIPWAVAAAVNLLTIAAVAA